LQIGKAELPGRLNVANFGERLVYGEDFLGRIGEAIAIGCFDGEVPDISAILRVREIDGDGLCVGTDGREQKGRDKQKLHGVKLTCERRPARLCDQSGAGAPVVGGGEAARLASGIVAGGQLRWLTAGVSF
jgi:hypothetical protein